METYIAKGKFINTCITKPSVRDPFILHSALFEGEGLKAWIDITEGQYNSIKLGKYVTIEYNLFELPNGNVSASLIGMEN